MEDSIILEEDKIVKILYNSETKFSRCVGFCKYHHAYMTKHQLKKKQCISKGCCHLDKKEHQFWQEREKKLARKNEKKNMMRWYFLKRTKSSIYKVQNSNSIRALKKSQLPERYVCIKLDTTDLYEQKQRIVKGLKAEVIQIAAVMLDENYNCISRFSTLVKPMYSGISEKVKKQTGITNEMVENADTFSMALYKYNQWVGNSNVKTYCWNDADYKQLMDETYMKARNHEEYYANFRTIVDLQSSIKHLFKSRQDIPLNIAVRFTHAGMNRRHNTALKTAADIVKVLHKISLQKSYEIIDIPLYKTVNTGLMRKETVASVSGDKDYTSSFASFMSADLLKKFTSEEKETKGHIITGSEERKTNWFTRRLTCTKYGIGVRDWVEFSFRMLMTKKMRNISSGA